MNYDKPEIEVLGEATARILGSNKRAPHQIDPGLPDEVASSYEPED